jgi:hypothetical protein
MGTYSVISLSFHDANHLPDNHSARLGAVKTASTVPRLSTSAKTRSQFVSSYD